MEDPFEHASAFNRILSDIKSQSIDLEAPVQNRLARDVNLVLREAGGMSRGEINAVPLDYSRISRAFPQGVAPPTNVGGAIDLLTRSHFPAWTSMAMEKARATSDPQNAFLEHFQTSATSFVENLGKFDPGKGQMPYFGIYNAVSSNTDRVRAEKRQRPAGTFGLDFPGTDEGGSAPEWGTEQTYQPISATQFSPAARSMAAPVQNRSLFDITQQGDTLPIGQKQAWRINQSLLKRMDRGTQYALYQKAVANRNTTFTGLTGNDVEAIGYNEAALTGEGPYTGTGEQVGGRVYDPNNPHGSYAKPLSERVFRSNRTASVGGAVVSKSIGGYVMEDPQGDDIPAFPDTASSVGYASEPYYGLPSQIGQTGPGQFQRFLAKEIDVAGYIKQRPVDRFYEQSVGSPKSRYYRERYEKVGEWRAAHKRNWAQTQSQEAHLDNIASKTGYSLSGEEYERSVLAEADAIAAEERQLLPVRPSSGVIQSGPQRRQRGGGGDEVYSGGAGVMMPVRAANPSGGGDQGSNLARRLFPKRRTLARDGGGWSDWSYDRSRAGQGYGRPSAVYDALSRANGEGAYFDAAFERVSPGVSTSQFGGGGGASGGVPPVPPVPPNFDDEPPFDDSEGDQPEFFDYGQPLPEHVTPETTAVLNALRGGRNAMGAMKPGWGKTQMALGAAVARGAGISLTVSPFTALSKSLEAQYRKAGVQAFFLPGDPGAGKDRTEYQAAHNAFRQAVARATDAHGNMTRSVVGIMSPEKAASLSPSHGIGKFLGSLSHQVKTVTIDEAQELTQGSRYLMKYLADNMQSMFPDAAKLLLGGTIPQDQIPVLAQAFGIQDSDIQRAPVDFSHLNFRSQAVEKGQYARAGGAMAGDTGIVYGHSTRLVEEMHTKAVAAGATSMMYHKGQGVSGPIPKEQLDAIEGVLGSGNMPEGTTMYASSAAGLGLDIKNIKHVGQVGPARASDIIQRALRMRPDRDNPGGKVGTFNMSVDPGQYYQWSRDAQGVGQELTSQRLGVAMSALSRTQLPENWRDAAEVAGNVLGKSLESQTGKRYMRYAGGEAFEMLQEAGLAIMELNPETGELNWKVQGLDPSISGSVLEQTQFRSKRDPSRTKSFRDYRSEAAQGISDEYRALGSFFQQTRKTSPEEQGKMLEGALTSYSRGGLGGLQTHVEQLLPAELANKYRESVVNATRVHEEEIAATGDAVKAGRTYAKSIQKAADSYLGSSHEAASIAEEQGRQIIGTGAAGGVVAGSDAGRAMLAGIGGGNVGGTTVPPVDIQSSGGGGGRAGGGIWSGGVGGLLYGGYIAKRMWGMIAAPVFQNMEKYAGAERSLAPLEYYGRSGEMNFSGSAAGFYARQQNAKMYLGQGAYEEFGAISDLGNIAAGSPSMSRMIASGRVVGGAAAVSKLMTSKAIMEKVGGFFGVGEEAVGAGKMLGPAIGLAAVFAGTLALGGEVVNAFDPDNTRLGEPAGIGGFTRAAARTAFVLNREVAGMASTVGGQGAEAGRGWYQDFMMKSFPGVWSWLSAPNQGGRQTQEAKDIRSNLRDLSNRTGMSQEELAPTYFSAQRLTGSALSKDQLGQIAEMQVKWNTEGISGSQGMSAGAGYISSLGMETGTQEAWDAAYKYNMMTPQQQERAERSAQRVAGFGAQLSSFMGGLEATKTARQYNFRTQGDVTPFQILLGLADNDKALGKITGANPMGQVTTLKDDLKQYASTLTGRQASWASQIADAAIGAGVTPSLDVYKTASRFGIGTDQEAQAAAGMLNTAASFGRLDQKQSDAIVGLSRQYAPAVGGIVAQNFMAPMYQAGMSTNDITSVMGRLGGTFKQWSPYQMGLAGQVWGGDTGAQSFAAWNQPQMMSQMGYNPSAYRTQDTSGNPIYETNGAAFISMIQGQAAQGNQAAQRIAGTSSLFMGGMAPQAIASSLGVQPNRMQSYMRPGGLGGMRAVMNDIRQDLYAAQDASAGISLAQIGNERQFLWGGGSWDKPGQGSMWYLQDQQRALSHQSQMANFNSQENRMNVNNQFAIRQEGLQLERMGISNDYSRFNLQIGREQTMLQRDYQSQVRSLQWQWKTEDYGEESRFLTGRQRRLAERQMGRDTTMHNLEGDQIEKQQALEDKRYQKSVEYTNKMIDLEKRQFDLNKDHRETMFKLDQQDFQRHKKEYLEQKKLEDEIIALQRKHQKDQLDFQAAQAANSLRQTKLQRELEEVTRKNAEAFGDVRGELDLINKYSNVVPVLNSIKTMLNTAGDVDPALIKKIDDLLGKLTSGAATTTRHPDFPAVTSTGAALDPGERFIPASGREESREIRVNLVLDGQTIQNFIIDTVSGELK